MGDGITTRTIWIFFRASNLSAAPRPTLLRTRTAIQFFAWTAVTGLGMGQKNPLQEKKKKGGAPILETGLLTND